MFDPQIPFNTLPLLPQDFDYNKTELLKLALEATEEIAKLNGLSYLVPNLEILISPLLIKESVESSAIENINTTTLKVLQSGALDKKQVKGPEKEVLSYHEAILHGYEKLKRDGGIGYNLIGEVQSLIEKNKSGIRKIPGTVIANSFGEVLYTPPSGEDIIVQLLTNLENFINNTQDDINPLIKMPVIHYQFESIHPFYDGNGRTGRIINILYLILAKKLDYPILFLSEYINKTRPEYYTLLGKTHITGDYTDIIIYLLRGITIQAKKTSQKIIKIHALMGKIENEIEQLKLDAHKMTLLFFSRPFLTLGDFEKHLGLSRVTIARQVNKLEKANILSSIKIGKYKLIYIKDFIDLLT